MGVDISGGMIVGANASTVESAVFVEKDDCEMYGSDGNYHEEFYEWYESEDMATYSYYYDAGSDSQVLGYTVEDIDPLADEFDLWVEDVKQKAQKFEELTGVEAKLIGMQNVW